MNKYQKVFPKCPYRCKGNKKCSHKSNNGNCIYSKPEKCQYYNEWVELRKVDSDCVETPLQSSHNKDDNN
jgi:hypothetical protein